MKKIMLVFALLFTVGFCSAQGTYTVVNLSGVTLDIGAEWGNDVGSCTPVGGSSGVVGSCIPHLGSTSFTIAFPLYRVGGSQNCPVGPDWGWTLSPCWMAYNNCLPNIAGAFTYIWNGCHYVEIH